MLAVGLLADEAPRDTGPDFGKASPFGLVIIVLLLIGTFALVWSMNRHLRKLPKSFDESEQGTESEDERRD
jgi:F0F1-type ATP synthase assembly protein I